jgi:hypothetical protein
MSDLAERAGVGENPNVVKREGKPPVAKPNVSSDESEHHPQVEVGPENILRKAPPGAERDPTYVPEKYLRADMHYRWVNKRKIDYRKFQGYQPVFYKDAPVYSESAEGYLQLGDCIFMMMPRERWEERVREREENWKALYKRRIEKTFNELDAAEGHPFVVEPDGKEVR